MKAHVATPSKTPSVIGGTTSALAGSAAEATVSALAGPTDYEEFFREERAVLAAGAVEQQRGKARDTAGERVPRLKKVTLFSQERYSARIEVAPLPANVQIFIISGFPGSGVLEFAHGAAKALRECKAVVVRINTDAFLGDRPTGAAFARLAARSVLLSSALTGANMDQRP